MPTSKSIMALHNRNISCSLVIQILNFDEYAVAIRCWKNRKWW
ncbi:hypothetical protein [Liberibacter crescens]|nr:hypothetical protein [Liberibacter crescens]